MNRLASVISSSSSSQEENYRNFKKLRRIYHKQEARTLHFEEKATWLSMAYVIFGAILYNSIIAQCSSSARNRGGNISWPINRWIPVSLLLSVSVAFWVQLMRTIGRYLGISHQGDVSWMQQQRMYHRLFIMDENEQRKVNDDKGSSELMMMGPENSIGFSHTERYVYIFTVLFALFIFTLSVLHACVSVLGKF